MALQREDPNLCWVGIGGVRWRYAGGTRVKEKHRFAEHESENKQQIQQRNGTKINLHTLGGN